MQSAVCCTRLKCVPWSTHSDRIQQPASNRTSLQQKRRTDYIYIYIYIASYIKRTDGNYSPMNFGHVREPFLHFSADTKQTRVLHYVSVREEEKGSVFKGPHEDTECQNSRSLGRPHIQFRFRDSDLQKQIRDRTFAQFIYLAYFIFVIHKITKDYFCLLSSHF